MALPDVLLLVIYGGVSLFFLRRFAQHRRLPSLGIAMLPLGWILIAVDSRMNLVVDQAKWAGVGVGVFLLTSVLNADRKDGG